ncbi:hypothetical protein FRX31_010785 [Thalictrum thalictroides]|uniref:CCHC-type domain-containing protein n=1 Tax=Thalictrum thalictroides TaxID=46969 RepID=A0A7J6WRQ3_THATH|nr:hypothetical protein FRX31_010785 [Thalictrum thalictroides]
MGKKFGKTLQVDLENQYGDFGSFFRIKVQIDSRVPLLNGIEYLNHQRQIKHFPIRIEKLNFFCFNCGKLGHEKIRCGDRNGINPKESNLSKRRYSVALKGFPPESILHDFAWFIDHQIHLHEQKDEVLLSENLVPVHQMQIDDIPPNLQASGHACETSPSRNNSEHTNPPLFMGPTKGNYKKPLSTDTCPNQGTNHSNLISIPIQCEHALQPSPPI